MPPDESAAAPAATTDTAAATSPTGVDPAAMTSEAQEAHLQASINAANEHAKKLKATRETSNPAAPRGKGGKFAAKDGKAAPQAAAKAVGETTPAAEPTNDQLATTETEKPRIDTPGAIPRARRLFAEGKIDEFSELVFGKPIEEVELSSRGWKELRAFTNGQRTEIEKKRGEVEAARAEVKVAASKVLPYYRAMQAYEKGDLSGFVKHATGRSMEDFLHAVAASARGGGGDIPAPIAAKLSELERRLAEKDAALQAREDAERTQREQQSATERKSTWMTQVSDAIAQSGDPELAQHAKRPAFLNRVYEIQGKSYSKKYNTCLPAIEAAAQAYDELYGDPEGEADPGRADNRGPTPRQGTASQLSRVGNRGPTGRPGTTGEGGRKPTTVRHSQAAEAAPIIDEAALPFDDEDKFRERDARVLERLIAQANSMQRH